MRPGLTLHYSNRAERLLDALAEALHERRRSGASPLEEATVAVPGPLVETWLKLGLARRTGLFANVRFRFLSGALEDALATALPGVRVADGAVHRGLLLRLLHDDALLGEDDLSPVSGYLGAAGPGPDAVDRRRWQLAERLAQLFEEYGFSRAETLAAWPRGALLDPASPHAAAERWQRRLWLALFGPGGLAQVEGALRGETWLPLPAALDRLEASPARGEPSSLHVFGFSYVARSFHRLLALLARRADLHVYALNPCREFWEDVQTPAERDQRLPRRRSRGSLGAGDDEGEDPFGLLGGEDENPLLSLWGRPGREHVRLLNELSDCDFDDRFDDPEEDRPTLLTRLQRAVLDRAPLSPSGGAPEPAASVRLLAAPSVAREAEAIAGEIVRLLREELDPPLRLNEVAVVVPSASMRAYHAPLAAAFRALHDLPWSAIDLPASAGDATASAFALLLDLPLGALTRREVLAAVSHPALLGRVPDATPGDLARWCEELGILRGADREDLAGTAVDRDLLTWDQGLRRLSLGAFLSGERSGEERPLVADGERYLPLELPPEELGRASAFALLVRSLLADARHARRARLTADGWGRFLTGLLDAYIPAGDEEGERGRLACLSAIRALASLPLGGQEVGYRVAHAAVAGALAGASSRRGSPLAEGIVVSTFLPMRAVPFRAVFAAGLDASAFPARDVRDLLDLRLARRRAGDVSSRERDQYLFLETLLSARDRLVLSWVATSPKSGEDVEPSPLVGELLAIGVPLERERIPERRDAEPAAMGAPGRAVPPAAAGEARARLLGESLRAHLGAGDRPLGLDELPDDPDLGAFLGLPPAPAPRAAAPESPPTVTLTLADLFRFLKCPAQATARHHLGLSEADDDDLADRDEEPFETPFLERHGLVSRLLAGALARAEEGDDAAFERLLEEGWDAEAQRLLSRAALPAGPLLDRERREQLRLLRGLADALRRRFGALPRGRAVRLGRADPSASLERLLDPIVLPDVPSAGGRRVRVELHGATRPLLAREETLLAVSLSDPKKVGDVPAAKAALEGFLHHAVLAAATAREGTLTVLALAPASRRQGGAPSTAEVALAPIAREEALGWLRSLAADFLAGAQTRLFPWEAALARRAAGETRPFGEIVSELARRELSPLDCDHGPVPRPRDLEAIPDAEAEALVDRRFGPFLSRVVDPRRKGKP